MQGKINTSFATYQSDLFESGLVAQIGPNAFAVWSAIKAHADYQTGVAWPSIRRLMELTGLASATVQKCLATLEAHRLLRSETKNKRRVYMARERLDIHLGARVICTIVVDYVPSSMRSKLAQVKDALMNGEDNEEIFAACEIIPGPGFAWDAQARVLRGTLAPAEMPPPAESLSDLARPIIERAKRKALPKK